MLSVLDLIRVYNDTTVPGGAVPTDADAAPEDPVRLEGKLDVAILTLRRRGPR